MEASTAQVNELERRIDLTVAIADLEREMEPRLKRMGRNLKMPGFRPGKVPFTIVKQQYGAQAHNEAMNEAIERAFSDAVRSQQLRVAGYPSIEPKDGAVEGVLQLRGKRPDHAGNAGGLDGVAYFGFRPG